MYEGTWKEKEPLSARKLNANDARNVTEIKVGPGLTITRVNGQVTINLNDFNTPIHIVRVHVTTLPNSSNSVVAGVTPWDGTNPTGAELYAKLLSTLASFPSSSSPEYDFLICRPFGGTDQTDPDGAPVVWEQLGADPATDYYGTLSVAWSPGQNTVTLQPCQSYSNATPLKDSYGNNVPTVPNVYISFPYNSVCPALQQQAVGAGPYVYRTVNGISYLVSPNQWPNPSSQNDVIVNMGTGAAPNYQANYPLGHS